MSSVVVSFVVGAIKGVRPFLLFVSGAWAVRLVLLNSDVNPLFALAAISLSVYGLWVLVGGRSDALIAKLDSSSSEGRHAE